LCFFLLSFFPRRAFIRSPGFSFSSFFFLFPPPDFRSSRIWCRVVPHPSRLRERLKESNSALPPLFPFFSPFLRASEEPRPTASPFLPPSLFPLSSDHDTGHEKWQESIVTGSCSPRVHNSLFFFFFFFFFFSFARSHKKIEQRAPLPFPLPLE